MQIVSACLARDLPVYRFAAESLRRHLPDAEIHVVTRREDCPKFREVCGSGVRLWDENEMVPDMTLGDLRRLPIDHFPAGAGWYFQQFLKYAFERVSNDDDYFLIWDADTVLLRPIELFDPEGRPYYTLAAEYHRPYFETFEALFGEPANREFSFISQHQLIHKPTLRGMLSEIETRHPGHKNWAWAIMANLKGEGSNLFSEYETYGHYCRLRNPDRCVPRTLPWTRDGRKRVGYPPDPVRLTALAGEFAFASFESNQSLRGLCVHWLRKALGWY